MTEFKELFLLDKQTTFLNFGSFGACPKEIFQAYQNWQLLLEQQPVKFIAEDAYVYIQKSIDALAGYLNCSSENLVLVTNPSYAFNAVIRSLELKNGDEVLSTSLEYGAMIKTWEYYGKQKGFRFIQQPISLPIASKEEFLTEFWSGYTDRTKAVFLSHITSATGLILPAEEICKEARRRGLIIVVDGAHVPGHIPLDLSSLDVDYYTGACHKWMMTPKGCSFLYAGEPVKDSIDPMIISWGYDAPMRGPNRFFDYHQFNGTRDLSAFLTIQEALAFREKYDWNNVSKKCRDFILTETAPMFDALGSYPLAPLDENFFGQLCSFPIHAKDPMILKRELLYTHGIEVPVIEQNKNTYIRISWQAFNDQEDANKFMKAIFQLKKEKTLSSPSFSHL